MIRANELRIGNLLFDTKLHKPIEIDIVQISHIQYCNYLVANPVLVHLSDIGFEVIPITEEWLLRFEFEKQTDSFVPKWTKGNFYILQVGEDSFCSDYYLLYGIYHIHQLQNLYFALTGQELIYEPVK